MLVHDSPSLFEALVPPSGQVDLVIESAAEALRGSAPYQAFRRGL
jgi:hypothetical protein